MGYVAHCIKPQFIYLSSLTGPEAAALRGKSEYITEILTNITSNLSEERSSGAKIQGEIRTGAGSPQGPSCKYTLRSHRVIVLTLFTAVILDFMLWCITDTDRRSETSCTNHVIFALKHGALFEVFGFFLTTNVEINAYKTCIFCL